LLSLGVGAVVTAIGGPWLGIPAAIATRMVLSSNSQPNDFPRYEKVINPSPELPSAKPITQKSAEKSFKELEQITERLLLEYKGA
jgi:hypothetical protein